MNREDALIKYNEIDKRVGIKPFWEVRDIIENAYNQIELIQKENIRLKKHIIKKRCCQDCKNYLSGFQSDGLLWENCELGYQCSNIFDNHFEEREKGCFDVI